MSYTLRPQQVTFEDALRDSFRRGNRCVLGTAPTGFGKGVVIADMSMKSAALGNRVLTVTNRRQIVRQLQEHCENVGLRCGVIMGSDERDEDAPVQIASIQTLKRRQVEAWFQPDLIILDEAHQEGAAYRTLLHEKYPGVRALGLTATPVGRGGTKLSHFDHIVEPIKNTEVIAAGHLLPVYPYLAPSEPDLGGINLKTASQDEVGRAVEACTVYGDVFAQWEPYKHMQTMVVLPNRAICNGFLNLVKSRGIRAKIVDGTTALTDRKDTFSEFKASDCQMLLGVDVVREGLDLPIAQCLIDLQPTHQFRVYWQKLGRVKRPHPGQKSAVVIDFAGNLWRHMVHPDQDPPWSEVTTTKTIEDIIDQKAGVKCPKCGSKDVYGPVDGQWKCEDCGNIWETKKPWVCPHCFQALSPWQKCVDGKCPNCGEKVGGKPTRRVRFENGEIRSVSADEVKRRKKSKAQPAQSEWNRWVYTAKNWNKKNPQEQQKTLNWCQAMYKKETGEYPPPGLRLLPSDPKDMRRRPEDVFPYLKGQRR